MNEDEQRAMLLDFEKNRQMLGNVSMQKQQFSMQSEMINASLEELEKTKEKSVYKAVGNILISKSVEEMTKELKEKKESVDLRLKTLEKQEENLLKKLNAIRSKVEGVAEKADAADREDAKVKEDKAKSEKKQRK